MPYPEISDLSKLSVSTPRLDAITLGDSQEIGIAERTAPGNKMVCCPFCTVGRRCHLEDGHGSAEAYMQHLLHRALASALRGRYGIFSAL
jgi:hypothetical protein